MGKGWVCGRGRVGGRGRGIVRGRLGLGLGLEVRG